MKIKILEITVFLQPISIRNYQALRKLASEAEDNNLLEAKIANGIRAVKGMPQRGRRTGNWLTREEANLWVNAPDVRTLKGLRVTGRY